MEINKKILEDKLEMLLSKHTKLNEEINKNLVLSHKLEGAIETIQMLLKEAEVEVNTNKE